MKGLSIHAKIAALGARCFLGTTAIAALLLGLNSLAAQAPSRQGPGGFADTVFDQLDHKSGLPGSVAQAITQDGDGFLWVGTEAGVARWDGYHFHNYGAQAGVAGTLPSSNIMTLYTDPEHRVWVGTNHGLALYDGLHDRFDTFTPTGPHGDYPSIYAMATDGSGGLWLATRKGLDHFDPATGKFQREPMVDNELSRNTPTLLRDPDRRIWVGNTHGLFVSDSTGHHFHAVTILQDKQPTVWSLLHDHAGRIWIGTTAGMYVLEPGATTPRPVHESGATSPLDQQGIDALAEVEPGIVWLATYGEGIVEVDTRTWQTHRILHQPSIPTSLAHNLVDVLFRDRAGTTWAGSVGGLSRRNPTGSGILTYFGGTGDAAHPIAGSDVTAVKVMPDGRLWLGLLEKGIQVFDASGRQLSESLTATPSKAAPKMQIVDSFAPATDGSMFFGSEQGLYHADRDGRHIQHIDLKNDKQVKLVVCDTAMLWFGTPLGLLRLPLPLTAGEQSTVRVASLPSAPITALLRGRDKDLWVGIGKVLYRLNTETLVAERAVLDAGKSTQLPAGVASLMLGHDSHLWVATEGAGLYQVTNGLHMSQINPVESTGHPLEAFDGTVWFAQGDGFGRLNPNTHTVETFNQADGVAISGSWAGAGTVAVDGRLYFGGVGGLTVIDPKSTHKWSYPAPIAVSSVSVGDKPAIGARQLANSNSAPIVVPSNANRLAIEFSALDFTAPEQNHYAYRLLGFDHDWVEADASNRVARYTNLPPGNYTLELRGSNRMGDWSTTRAVRIRVQPAWYQTFGARLLAFLAAVLVVVVIVRIYTAVLRSGQRTLKRKVAARTHELEKLTVKLQRSQLELERIAYQDSLTGLPNRRRFTECFSQSLEDRRLRSGPLTLILIDLDNFKSINDTLGHDAGDALLQTVAHSLSGFAHREDCFARIGGDEFALLLHDVDEAEQIGQICLRMSEALEQSPPLQSGPMRTTLSMGIALYPADGQTQESLYKAADLALYAVKRAGRNGWRRYAAEEQTKAAEVAAPRSH